jgi:hypothetical protein
MQMSKITIIQLLNKIANGEEVPKKIKYNNINYYWCNQCKIYERIEDGSKDLYNDLDNLNDEAEIIEEKKIPEKLEEIGKIDYNLGYIDYKNIEVLKTWLNNDMSTIFNELDLIVKNQNQLIDYLESKGQ